ncbi:MAG: PSD1 domain-containing protein [Planctomycetaceae bacterium]|nr:PSD1 domain-containing protein [Planctomycetaceae bacterium]
MIFSRTFNACTVLCTMILCSLPTQRTTGAPDDTFFEKQVRPLLVKRCYKCHSGTKTSGSLALDSRAGWQRGGESGPAIMPGQPESSLLVQAINYDGLEMPPNKAGGKLSDAEIAILTKWVKLGANDPRTKSVRHGGMSSEQARSWWAFQSLPKLTEPVAPQEIDRFVDASLKTRSLVKSSPADRRTLIRRATYDLTGLPPTPEDVDRFVSDESDDAFAKVIDRLLASPQYGVKWGRHWLDVVRYADTAGENTDRPLPHAWRYRNWVIDSFNHDLPFDQFVRMQLAGDLLQLNDKTIADGDGIIATGYLAIARRFGHDIDKDIHLMHEDVIDNVGKNFLGLSIGCARCHDHKYDPLTAEDYYALYGIFSSTRFAFPGCEPNGQPRDLVPLLTQAEIDSRTNAWRQRNEKAVAEKKRLAESSDSMRTTIRELAAKSSRLLAESKVDEGASVSFVDSKSVALDQLPLKKGEILQLTVSPNASHGADTTLVEWEISETSGPRRTWSVADFISTLTDGNPRTFDDGSSWSFLDVTDGPVFLTEKKDVVAERSDLNAWSLGDTPSVLVNRSTEPIKVWTTLPPRSFFVHPGVNRNVAVAWVCPGDMTVTVKGRVADSHPAGGDGVAFRLDHIAAEKAGPALVELGMLASSPDIFVEPQPSIPVAYAVVEGSVADACLHQRGDPEQPGDAVPRRWLSIFGGEPVPSEAGSGRRQLGDWIVGHPLSARVMVNRIWQWHLGRGLVSTPNDFGARGERPSHPELLDWLAAAFRESGYSVKSMHRLIMLTDAYRRSSEVSDSSATDDADNRYLSRFARRRLNAEEIRDSLLAAGNNLDTSPAEAHPFPAEATWNFTQHNPFSAVYTTSKRSAFLMVQRQRRDPYLALFDGADPNASTAVRQRTTVPTQALYFMNAPFVHEQAAGFARRLLAADVPNDHARVQLAFRLLYQRQPTPAEVEHGAVFLEQYPGSDDEKWAAWSRVLITANEFLYLD